MGCQNCCEKRLPDDFEIQIDSSNLGRKEDLFLDFVKAVETVVQIPNVSERKQNKQIIED